MYYTDEQNEKNMIERINDAKKLFDKQESEVEYAEKILCLCKQDLCKAIKSYTTTYDFIGENVSKANEELQIKDKRKKKENLDFINSLLSKDFFDNKVRIKVNKIIFYGGNTSEYGFEFELNGEQYRIITPVKANLSFDYDDYFYGRFYIANQNEHTTAILYTSFSIKGIREYIVNNILKEKENNEM